VAVTGFFSSRLTAIYAASDDGIILDCYRLARWYGQNPELFLNMTLGEITLHMKRTAQLARIMRAEQTESDGD